MARAICASRRPPTQGEMEGGGRGLQRGMSEQVENHKEMDGVSPHWQTPRFVSLADLHLWPRDNLRLRVYAGAVFMAGTARAQASIMVAEQWQDLSW